MIVVGGGFLLAAAAIPAVAAVGAAPLGPGFLAAAAANVAAVGAACEGECPALEGAWQEGAEEADSIAFRSDTSHIFRDATGHLLEDTPANREVIQGAIDPANLRSTITLSDGSTLARYFQTLPEGTQAWAEVRNGVEITNGGVNATPR